MAHVNVVTKWNCVLSVGQMAQDKTEMGHPRHHCRHRCHVTSRRMAPPFATSWHVPSRRTCVAMPDPACRPHMQHHVLSSERHSLNAADSGSEPTRRAPTCDCATCSLSRRTFSRQPAVRPSGCLTLDHQHCRKLLCHGKKDLSAHHVLTCRVLGNIPAEAWTVARSTAACPRAAAPPSPFLAPRSSSYSSTEVVEWLIVLFGKRTGRKTCHQLDKGITQNLKVVLAHMTLRPLQRMLLKKCECRKNRLLVKKGRGGVVMEEGGGRREPGRRGGGRRGHTKNRQVKVWW